MTSANVTSQTERHLGHVRFSWLTKKYVVRLREKNLYRERGGRERKREMKERGERERERDERERREREKEREMRERGERERKKVGGGGGGQPVESLKTCVPRV